MDEESKKESYKLFFKYFDKVTTQVRNHPDYDINKNNNHLFDKNGKTALRILDYIVKLDNLVDDVRKVEIFMRRFSNNKLYSQNNIDQLSYIKYHYEVFLHKIHTILEVKKLSINEIYGFGLKEIDCSWENLKKNPKIKETNTTKIIENYFKTFNHLIKHRHLNSHRAIFADKKNDELNLDYRIYQNSEKLNLDLDENFKKLFPKFLIEYKIKEYRKEKINYVKDGIKAIEIYVEQFQIVLINEFLLKLIKKKPRIT